MPFVGTPYIVPLSTLDGYPDSVIDTDTFIELESETPDVNIFFTADGTRPNPFNRFPLGREQTFKYSGPFKLREGKRQLKVVAVHRATKHPSCIASRSFHVLEAAAEPKVKTCGSDCDICYPTRPSDTKNQKENICDLDCDICYPSKSLITRISNSKTPTEVLVSTPRSWRPYPLVPYVATVDPPVNRSGFNSVSTNQSGTQINVWGPHPSWSLGPDLAWPLSPRIYPDWRYGYPHPYWWDSPLVTRRQLTNFSNQLNSQLLTARQKIADDVREALTGRTALKPITDRKY